MNKVNAQIGYTRKGLDDYKTDHKNNLVGIDITITDGKGNRIIVSSRQGTIGSKITINEKVLFNN